MFFFDYYASTSRYFLGWSCFFFFFKQKTAYEIMPSLVGSEMCIRDSPSHVPRDALMLGWHGFGRYALPSNSRAERSSERGAARHGDAVDRCGVCDAVDVECIPTFATPTASFTGRDQLSHC